MPNLAIGLCIGLSAWTICMGSTALSVGSGSKEAKILPSFRTTNFTDSKDVKKGNKELPCIGSLFGEIDWSTTGTQLSALKNENTEGCLAVWWEKSIYDNGKWKGSWNLLLGMKDNEYGIVFSQSINVGNGKLVLDSSLYNLNKKDKWSLITSDVYGNGQEVGRGEINKKILLPKNKKNKGFEKWSFDFSEGDICSSTNSCTSDSPVNKFSISIWNFVSEFGGGGANLIYKWFEDVENIYCCGSDIENRLLKVKGSFELVS